MTYAEMLEELKKLTPTERLTLMEVVLQLMREELQHRVQPVAAGDRAQQLAAAAQALLLDYTTDSELTSFTALDSEDFYEAR